MMSNYADRLIEEKYNGKLKDIEWLCTHFNDLYLYLKEIIDYNSEHYLVLESNIGGSIDTDISTTVVLNTDENVYIIKATIMRDKQKWDDEHWLNTSCLRCMCTNSIKSEENIPIYSGVYNKYSWDIIKDKILSNEFRTVNYNLFT